MGHAQQAGGVLGAVQAQQIAHLPVLVQLHHHTALVARHKGPRRLAKRQRPQPQGARWQPARPQQAPRLLHRRIRGAVENDTELRRWVVLLHRLRHQPPGRLVLAAQPIHVRLPVLRLLAVDIPLVMSSATAERGGERVGVAWQRAGADPVAVRVGEAHKAAQALQLLGAQELAAIQRLLGVGERRAGPEIHAEVEIAQHKHGRLQALGEIEGAIAALEALGHAAGQQHHLAGVAVAKEVGGEDVALGGAGGHAGGWADPLHVPDNAGDLGEVGQAGELGHQGDTGAGGARHRAGARPASADHHAERGDLVLGLHDRVVGVAVWAGAQAGEVGTERVGQASGRGDRVPGQETHATEDGPDRGGGVAVDQDLATVGLHRRKPVVLSAEG